MTENTNEPRLVWSHNEEDFNGANETLGDLLDYCADDAFEVGQTVYFGERVEHGTDWIDADDVIDTIAERGYDQGGEHAEDFPEVSAEAKAELAEFLRDWQAKHCKATFFRLENVRPYKLTAEDLA